MLNAFLSLAAALRAAAIAAGLVLASSAVAADETVPVPKPAVKEGDAWTYQVTNLVANAPKPSKVDIRVTFVSADAIVTVDRLENGQENDSQYSAEWAMLSLSTGQVFDRPFRLIKFPLKVGESYPIGFEVSFRGSPVRSRSEGTAKVVGWEDVVVPAGKFRAIKIEARGAFQRLDTRHGAPQRWEVWYVPEVKRWVKTTYEEGLPGRDPDTKRRIELLEFKVQ